MAKRKRPRSGAGAENERTYVLHKPNAAKRPRSEKPDNARSSYVLHAPAPKSKASERSSFKLATPKRETPTKYVLHDTTKPPKPWAPNGSCWHFDGDTYLCVYGCKSIRLDERPADDDWHAYNCPYWFNEGIDETPF